MVSSSRAGPTADSARNPPTLTRPGSSPIPADAPGQEADPPVPELEQVPDGDPGAGQVVRVHGGQVGVAGVRVDRHHRDPVVALGDRGRDDHRPVDQGAAQAGERASLPADVADRPAAAAGVGEELVAAALRGARQPLEQFGAERLELGHQHADHAGAARAEAPGDEAGLEAELGDHLPYPDGRPFGHAVAVVDHLRDRRDRHAGRARHVHDGGVAGGGHGGSVPR
jgi:hypothetical protein